MTDGGKASRWQAKDGGRLGTHMPRRSKEEIRASQRAAHEAFGDALWEGTNAALADEDPLGLVAAGAPRNAYDLEVETILPRLCGCSSATETCTAIFEEFERCFGVGRVGPPERYAQAAERVWSLWKQRDQRYV